MRFSSSLVFIEIQASQNKSISKAEFWVDGQYQFDVPVNKPFSWYTRMLEDGNHEIRLAAIEDSHIETRSSASFNIQVFNNHHQINVNPINQAITYDEIIEITGLASGADKVELVHGYNVISEAKVKDSRWKLSISAWEEK